FTDTKNYRRLISECVNIGVGYQDQHSKDEFLDYGHAFALMNACLKVDWAALEGKAQRDPSAPEISWFGGMKPDRAWLDEWEPARPQPAAKAPPAPKKKKEPLSLMEELDAGLLRIDDLELLASESPEEVARLIVDLYLRARQAETAAETLRSFLDI
ncbi:hypothetical protein KTH35_19305, partial [Acinetobacter baumannii]|nr:hypothetical protein [Acinetobacter baumannii]